MVHTLIKIHVEIWQREYNVSLHFLNRIFFFFTFQQIVYQPAYLPLICSMKHTLPLVLKAKVSGVMQRVWKTVEWAMFFKDWLHSRQIAQISCSVRQLSCSERTSASDTFSCQDKNSELLHISAQWTWWS